MLLSAQRILGWKPAEGKVRGSGRKVSREEVNASTGGAGIRWLRAPAAGRRLAVFRLLGKPPAEDLPSGSPNSVGSNSLGR